MPIDRPDPADAPGTPAPPDAPASPDTPRTPDALPPRPTPADRDAIHCAYRAQADRIYAARRAETRDGTPAAEAATAWADAVPSLRATWADHQERYPERARATPVTHPDNSWTSGETRRLTPDQNTEGQQGLRPTSTKKASASSSRPCVTVEARRPGPPAWPAWMHMCKGADRLKEKVAERLRHT